MQGSRAGAMEGLSTSDHGGQEGIGGGPCARPAQGLGGLSSTHRLCVRLPHSQKTCGVLGTVLGLPGPTSRAHKGL